MKKICLMILIGLSLTFTAWAQNFNINMKIGGTDNDKEITKEDAPQLKTISAELNDEMIILGDGRTIPFKYIKSQTPWPNIEVLEPVGAKVKLFEGDRMVYSDEIPFLWKKAKIDEYIKMVVVENNVTWFIKFQTKKLNNVEIGKRSSSTDEMKLSVILKSKHFSIPKGVFQQGDAITVDFFDMPGNSHDWITVVPEGSPNDTWGDWKYTDGKNSGTYTLPVLKSGKYELRAYYDYPQGGYAIQDRLKFTVE